MRDLEPVSGSFWVGVVWSLVIMAAVAVAVSIVLDIIRVTGVLE